MGWVECLLRKYQNLLTPTKKTKQKPKQQLKQMQKIVIPQAREKGKRKKGKKMIVAVETAMVKRREKTVMMNCKISVKRHAGIFFGIICNIAINIFENYY